MRWHKAQDMASRVGWHIGSEDQTVRGKLVDFVFLTRNDERIWLCPFTLFVRMSKADFAASLARLPQEAKSA